MKLSDMKQQELEYFAYLCKKFEVEVSSTEALRDVIKTMRKSLEEQEKAIQEQLKENNKILNEYEKMIANLEKGAFRK